MLSLTGLVIITAAIIMAAIIVAGKEEKKDGTSMKEEFVGICKSAVETASHKETRKQKALAMFEGSKELSNAEIRKALGISSRTAVRYLDELEAEGKLKQVGAIGHTVTYPLK